MLSIDTLIRTAVERHQAGHLADAEMMYRQILQHQPNHPDILHLLGLVLADTGRHQQSVEFIRRAIAINPTAADYHNNLGSALRKIKQFAEAKASFEQAIALRPDFPEAWYNLGNTLRDQEQFDDAASSYQRAIALRPGYVKAMNNLGSVHQSQGRWREALECFRQALAWDATSADVHWNYGTTLLALGDYSQGWREYEWRTRVGRPVSAERCYAQPRWNGNDLSGKTIFVYCEQGFGDAIQFVRYVPLLKQRGADVIIEAPAELTQLFSRVDGVRNVDTAAPLNFDVHAPLLSLPLAFATTLETIPTNVPYLSADPDVIKRWRHKLAASGDGLKVGLAWAGSSDHELDRHRSLVFDLFQPIAEARGITPVSLQKGKQSEQLRLADKKSPFIDFTEDLTDFAETAGLISNLDLVISADTAVAHLAGALNKPVWTLLPFIPDWRWLLERNDSPWYPSMRLFRQATPGDWHGVIASIVQELAAVCPKRST